MKANVFPNLSIGARHGVLCDLVRVVLRCARWTGAKLGRNYLQQKRRADFESEREKGQTYYPHPLCSFKIGVSTHAA